MIEKELTGYCGHSCGDCIRYKCRDSDLANELLNEFENFNLLIASLKAIAGINCATPRGVGGDDYGCTYKNIKVF